MRFLAELLARLNHCWYTLIEGLPYVQAYKGKAVLHNVKFFRTEVRLESNHAEMRDCFCDGRNRYPPRDVMAGLRVLGPDEKE